LEGLVWKYLIWQPWYVHLGSLECCHQMVQSKISQGWKFKKMELLKHWIIYGTGWETTDIGKCKGSAHRIK
jgi:hypothetical protein